MAGERVRIITTRTRMKMLPRSPRQISWIPESPTIAESSKLERPFPEVSQCFNLNI